MAKHRRRLDPNDGKIDSCSVCPYFPTLASLSHAHQTFIKEELFSTYVFVFRGTCFEIAASDLREFNKTCLIQKLYLFFFFYPPFSKQQVVVINQDLCTEVLELKHTRLPCWEGWERKKKKNQTWNSGQKRKLQKPRAKDNSADRLKD